MTRLDVTRRHQDHSRRVLVPSPVNGQSGKVDQARVSQHFQVAGSFLLVELILERLLTDAQSTKIPKLTRATLVNTEVHLFIQYIHQLLCHEAFDDSVLGNMIDTETVSLLQYILYPTETSRRHPISNHWTID